MTNKRRLAFILGVLFVALWAHIALISMATDNIDVRNFARVGEVMASYGAFGLYSHTKGIYPYPPLWASFIWASRWLSLHSQIRFSWAIRIPGVLSDLGIVYLCWSWWWHARDFGLSRFSSVLYAVSPVPLIITCLHGQFDALPTLFLLWALFLYLRRRWAASAIALGVGIAAKPFPVLVLPWLVLRLPGRWTKLKFALLSALPTISLLTPFLLHDPVVVINQVFGYRGVALLGFMVPFRSIYAVVHGGHFPVALTYRLLMVSKWAFLVAYFLWMVFSYRKHASVVQWSVGVFALFYGLYGGISPQYLLWVYPLLMWMPPGHIRGWAIVYTVEATLALVGFYAYAVPRTVNHLWHGGHAWSSWLYGGAGTLWWFTMLFLVVWLSFSIGKPASRRVEEGILG